MSVEAAERVYQESVAKLRIGEVIRCRDAAGALIFSSDPIEYTVTVTCFWRWSQYLFGEGLNRREGMNGETAPNPAVACGFYWMLGRPCEPSHEPWPERYRAPSMPHL
jgi:hypothetical protein